MNKYLILLLFPLFLTGCYHAQVMTGAPASNEVYTKAWASSFIAGLVPPAVVNAEDYCSNGVAKVETRHSFLNMMAQMVTFSIYSLIELTVTRASESCDIPSNSTTLELAADAYADEIQRAYSDAALLTSAAEEPVYLNFNRQEI